MINDDVVAVVEVALSGVNLQSKYPGAEVNVFYIYQMVREEIKLPY